MSLPPAREREIKNTNQKNVDLTPISFLSFGSTSTSSQLSPKKKKRDQKKPKLAKRNLQHRPHGQTHPSGAFEPSTNATIKPLQASATLHPSNPQKPKKRKRKRNRQSSTATSDTVKKPISEDKKRVESKLVPTRSSRRSDQSESEQITGGGTVAGAGPGTSEKRSAWAYLTGAGRGAKRRTERRRWVVPAGERRKRRWRESTETRRGGDGTDARERRGTWPIYLLNREPRTSSSSLARIRLLTVVVGFLSLW